MSAQLLLLEPELREVLEPLGLIVFLFWSPPTPSFPPDGAVAGLDDLEGSVRLSFLFGFFFSLANMDCLATREILCCLGELEPGGGGAAVKVVVLPAVLFRVVLVAATGLLVLPAGLAVVVINNPAAVFLDVAELSLLVDGVIEVLARVILGPVEETEETTVLGTALTLLAKVEVIFTWDLALSSDFSLLQVAGTDEACWDLAAVEAVGAVRD